MALLPMKFQSERFKLETSVENPLKGKGITLEGFTISIHQHYIKEKGGLLRNDQWRIPAQIVLKFFILDMKLVECNLPCKFGRKALPKISKEKMQTEPINDVQNDPSHDVQGNIQDFSKEILFFSDDTAGDEIAKSESDGTKNDRAQNVRF